LSKKFYQTKLGWKSGERTYTFSKPSHILEQDGLSQTKTSLILQEESPEHLLKKSQRKNNSKNMTSKKKAYKILAHPLVGGVKSSVLEKQYELDQ
jgi:hypothetical protein